MSRSSSWSGNQTFNLATRVQAPYGIPDLATSVLGVALLQASKAFNG